MSTTIPKVRWELRPHPSGNGTTSFINESWYEGLLVSEPHWRVREVRGTRSRWRWSGGGPFYVYRRTCEDTMRATFRYKKSGVDFGTYIIAGVIGTPRPSSPPAVPSWSSQQSDLNGYYATGYRRARPGNAVANVGQFLVELRDLPSLPGRALHRASRNRRLSLPRVAGNVVPVQSLPRTLYERLKVFRSLGSEYLNVVFGWRPFVSDLQKMYNLWQDIDSRMAKIVRENGRYIRRKATVEDSTTVSQTVGTYSFPFANCYGGPPTIPGTSLHTVTTRTKKRVWFSGSFRYYIPDTGSSLWDARARLALFGALPTPEVIWEVLPWSWLIDWFGNVGDVISNASSNAVDNLTCRYSFIMKHERQDIEASCDASWPASTAPNDKWSAGTATIKSVYTLETKLRQGGGNPFGLNVQLSSLSAYQLSILAALGISRGAVK